MSGTKTIILRNNCHCFFLISFILFIASWQWIPADRLLGGTRYSYCDTPNEISCFQVRWTYRGIFPSGDICHGPAALVGRDLIFEVLWSHSDTPHSVGLLWTSDQPDAETCTWQHSQQTSIYNSDGIRYRNHGKRAPADPPLRPRGHWDQSSGDM